MTNDETPECSIPLLDHGFVRLDEAMADDLSVVNGARVSFARRKTEMDDSDAALIRFLMRDRHGSPFEHNAFRFHIRSPIFVAREWFRHRIGCLTGDTVVSFRAPDGGARELTIDELWRLTAPVTAGETGGAGGTGRDGPDAASPRGLETTPTGSEAVAAGREALKGLRLRVVDEQTGAFTLGRLDGVLDKGLQPVYRITLADGRELTLTENHRLLTNSGWLPMREALGMIGSGAEAQMVRRCLLLTEPGLRRDGLRARHERVAPPSTAGQGRSQARGGPLGVLRPPPRQLGGAAACRPLHRPARAGLETPLAAPSAVVALRYVGVRQTYDLSVAGRWHNFLANGIVVHNSFNEFSLRYAKASDDFYVPAAADVRTQVGKPGAYSFEPVEAALAEHTRARLQALYEEAFATYEELVEAGVARELARSVLPVGAYTQFYWTVNARALMNFVSLRNSEFAQLEIRRYAEAVEQCFAEQMPVTHAAFVANGRVAP